MFLQEHFVARLGCEGSSHVSSDKETGTPNAPGGWVLEVAAAEAADAIRAELSGFDWKEFTSSDLVDNLRSSSTLVLAVFK
jgi:hypothetical protein